jgi:hypothetical protein
MHSFAKHRMRSVASDLEAAQNVSDLSVLAGEVEEARDALDELHDQLQEVTA